MSGEIDWEIVRVADLPVPVNLDHDEPPCTARGPHVVGVSQLAVGVNPLSRQLAQAFPRRGGGPSCCQYHQVDWHTVCSLANFLFAHWGQDALVDWAMGAPRGSAGEQFLPKLEYDALRLLWIWPLYLMVDPATGSLVDYYDGQHRALAMMRAGVPRVVVDTAP